jgi:hypothetical protein
MRVVFPRCLLCILAGVLAASVSLPGQQIPDTFRWMDFHSSQDQSTVVWVTRALQVEKWTAIREIGVLYDAALVVTTDRPGPQSLPGDDTFNVWSVSLTNHQVTPLLKGANVRWFNWERFANGAPLELPILYDNCHDCAASTYFTAFHYDMARHDWEARWLSGGQGVPVWNAKPSSSVIWTQVYAVLAEEDGHVELGTWNHFDYGKPKPPEDILFRYDLGSFSELDRRVVLSGKEADAMKARLCTAQDAVPGLAGGQDSPLCAQLKPQYVRQPVTTPPANNRGRSVPPGGRH